MLKFLITLSIISFCAVLSFGTFSVQRVMEERLASYNDEFTNCDSMDIDKTNQIFSYLTLNPGPDAKSLKLIGSALKRVRELKLTDAKPLVRDIVDTMIDPTYVGNSDIDREMKLNRHLALMAFAALCSESSDAAILYGWYTHRKLDNVSEYLIARTLFEMNKCTEAVKAVNGMLDLMASSDRSLADDAFVYTLLDAVEKQGSRDSITHLFLVQKKFGNNHEIYNRISEVVGNLSTYGTN
jgi:hypothetical protein